MGVLFAVHLVLLFSLPSRTNNENVESDKSVGFLWRDIFKNSRTSNLLSTSASANRSKGAKGPSRWMPNINKCAYAKKWQRLVEKYRLVINSAEAEVLTQACTGLKP